MIKRKLNKDKVAKAWEDGGRIPSKWCNVYLVNKLDSYYLVEQANWISYLVYLLALPVLLIVLLIVVLHKILESIVGWLETPIEPIAAAHMSLFTKEKYRTDIVRKYDLDRYNNC